MGVVHYRGGALFFPKQGDKLVDPPERGVDLVREGLAVVKVLGVGRELIQRHLRESSKLCLGTCPKRRSP